MAFDSDSWNSVVDAPAVEAAADVVVDEPSAPAVDALPDPGEPPAEETAVTEPAEEDALPVAADADAKTPEAVEDLPEGATVRERNGKKEWVYTPERGREIYEGHKLAKQAQEIFGEDVTADSLTARQNAHVWLETQRLDILSNNPDEQINAFANIFLDIEASVNSGEVSHDPRATIGAAFAATMARHAPDAYATMANGIITDKIADLYKEAAKSGNSQLLHTVQNLDAHFTGKWLKDDEVAKSVPSELDARIQDLEAREAVLRNAGTQQAQRQWKAWSQNTIQSTRDAVKSAVTDSIPQAIKDAYKSDPDSMARIEKLLKIEVEEDIRNDPKWAQARQQLIRRAELGSEANRSAVAKELVQRYTARARQVISTKAAGILTAETKAALLANAATLKKHEAVKDRKGVPGASVAPTRLLPNGAPPGGYNLDNWSAVLNS